MGINWRQYTPSGALDSLRARPGQTLLRTGLGALGTALGGPLLGQAINQGIGAWQDRRNDAQFNEGAQRLLDSGTANLNQQIWGSGSPGGYTPSVPSSPSYGVQSPLLASLGVPNYTQPQANEGLPGITSSLAGSGYGPSAQPPSGNPGWVSTAGNYGAGVGAYGAFHGVGSSPNRHTYQGGVSPFSSPYIEY